MAVAFLTSKRTCHAEMIAVLNKDSSDVKDCTIYVTLFTCNECAKKFIQSGIKEVVYMSDKHSKKVTTVAAKRMFNKSKVIYRKCTPKNPEIVINFTDLNNIFHSYQMDAPVKSVHIYQNLFYFLTCFFFSFLL
ncbi:deoxycytidylate deaminase-like isoform X2 [Lycorma delicatula]|uniref:deoxycytidylate deaminase-like isoform X2 n=1 Tax=Lycorma delicatula TaxID=130591 RepID=UPI003F50F0B7